MGSTINTRDSGGVNLTTFPSIQEISMFGSTGFDAGDDTVTDSYFAANCYGNGGDDVFNLGGGDDVAEGGEGNDTLLGEAGNDDLQGNEGNDTLDGGDGDDILNAEGGGDNHLYPGSGSDVMVGGNGRDAFHPVFNPNDREVESSTISDDWGEDILDFSESTAGGGFNLSLLHVAQIIDESGQILTLHSDIEHYLGSPHDDQLVVRPLTAYARNLDGGAQDTADVLTVETMGFAYTDNGSSISVTGFAPINYENWETVIIDETPSPSSSWSTVKQLY
jgi:hypothetical protein